MRVEQRIGRVHRLGQQHDVKIYNLSTKRTIEEHILTLLHEKINMFEAVIGELDTILERFEKKATLESSLFRMAMESRSDEEVRRRLDELGDTFREVREEAWPAREEQPFGGLLDAVGGAAVEVNAER
jgi:superfamily II DNA or RNA helicase